ncbi:phage antirepressor KilAC domain-containing protein [uncultured Selenomonas sp.]|uniref:phage antirepressor n=1 Tax=uncultured Selenomonas sp. TaxID=159275 RepID=UPI0025895D1A|nr:phage antirepressor KilAC domain-containing protein [uncultured Selenomonas sp.]
MSDSKNLQVFNSPEFGQVRTVSLANEPWFVGKDVADILGYKNPNEAIHDHVDGEDRFLRSERGSEMLKLFSSVKEMQKELGRQDNWFINESGVYSLVFGSKLPTAKKFKHWVTSEVLPAIRKTGGYRVNGLTGRELMAKALLVAQAVLAEKDATIAKSKQIIGELKPKADYTDRILNSKSLVTITQIAKDYGISGAAMNAKLHEMGVIYKLGGQWLLYSKYQAKGYTHSETVDITHSDGRADVKMNTKWTQKGRLFLYQHLKKHGILPTIEQDQQKPLLTVVR